jgi:pimeloyl-ACP methyl ester carboxylesterase
MTTFLICHGAWSAGWAWGKVRPLLRAAGHEIHTPTYTGLGERAHLVSPQVDLETHIQDVLSVIEFENLTSFVLLGHSYGGMVATGVADRVPERVKKLIYLDAFVPENGQSLNDLRGPVPPPAAPPTTPPLVDWLLPPMPPAQDTSPEDLAWTGPRRRPQPVKTFTQKLHLLHPGKPRFPRAYIYCAKKEPGDVFLQFSKRFKSNQDWHYVERDWSHSPNVTAPAELANLLIELASS